MVADLPTVSACMSPPCVVINDISGSLAGNKIFEIWGKVEDLKDFHKLQTPQAVVVSSVGRMVSDWPY